MVQQGEDAFKALLIMTPPRPPWQHKVTVAARGKES